MKVIYVDNFRGFQDTIIPLERVNFLVGENSTGKTSILSLLYIISDYKLFWLRSAFNNNEVEMGSFEDLVSFDSDNKKSFSVGFLSQEEKSKSSKLPISNIIIIVTYINDNGVPTPSKITYTSNNKVITIKISKKSIA